jgi:hypothetical protein
MSVLQGVVLLLAVLLAPACRLLYASFVRHGRDLLRLEALERQLAGTGSRQKDELVRPPVQAAQIDPAVSSNPQCVDGLDISPAADGYMVSQPQLDRVHFLNPPAVLILELCNGANSEREIAELIRDGYGLEETPAETVVEETLAKMKAEGLLR